MKVLLMTGGLSDASSMKLLSRFRLSFAEKDLD